MIEIMIITRTWWAFFIALLEKMLNFARNCVLWENISQISFMDI